MTEDSPETPPARPPSPPAGHRIFLVVVDESPELNVALAYACRRARRTGGRVALLYVIEPTEFQHWMAVEALIREERRTEAEQRLLKLAKDVNQQAGTLPVLYIREGDRREELFRLIKEEPSISILVLASGTGAEGPGPLISYLTGPGINNLRIPLTVVPGNLTPDQIDAIT